MEHKGEKIYGFYDGDFTFHVAEYSVSCLNYTFRVRIDNSPEKRALENVSNPNQAPVGLQGTRPATADETSEWLSDFEVSFFPQRKQSHTDCLRHLRLHGPTPAEFFGTAAEELEQGAKASKNFFREHLRFVRIENGVASLTEDGLWLTSLMK